MGNQTGKNIFSNIFNLTINVFIGLLYTPYLVKTLGIGAYGIIPLALIINQYILVITESLTGSLTRFYSISVQNNENENASKYLSTSFYTLIVIIIILTPVFYLIVNNVSHIFNIPSHYINETKILFSLTLSSFSLSLISSLFNVTLYANNRLDLLNTIKIIRNISKVIIAISFLSLISKSVSYIGYANIISEIIVLILSYSLYKSSHNKEIKIKFKYLDTSKFKVVILMTSWVIVQRIGDTTLYRIDNIVVNKYFGIANSGILGAISEFGSYIINVVLVISSVFGPMILIAYSKYDHNKVKNTANDGVWMVGVTCSIIVGVIIAFSSEILTLWLGQEYSSYSIWLILKIISLPFVTSSIIFAYIFRTWNKIKIPAITTVFFGLINLATAISISIIVKNETTSIILLLTTCSIINIFQSFIFGLYYLKKIYPEIKTSEYIVSGIQFIVIIGLSTGIGMIYKTIIKIHSVPSLILACGFTVLILIIILWLFIINNKRKNTVLDIAKSFIKIKNNEDIKGN